MSTPEATAEILIGARSSSFSSRAQYRVRSCTSSARSRVKSRSRRISGGGTKLGRSMPRSVSFASHTASFLSVLARPGTFLTARIDQLSDRVTELIDQIPAAQGVDADGTIGPGAGTGPGAPVLPAVARLDEITGCGVIAAQAVIAEIGLDMTVFGTPGRLVSWAKRCPQTRQSGKKTTSGKAGKGNPYLNGILGEVAASASRTDTFLGERYRRLARRRGKRKALAAIARSILVIIFHLLADPEARFHDLGPDFYDNRISRERKIRNHVRQLEALGLTVTLAPKEEAA